MVRRGCAVMVCGLVLVGCTSGESRPSGSGSTAARKPDVRATADASPASVVDIDPARVPKTAPQAAAMVRNIIAEPSAFGPDTVRRAPYESGPRRWAVLGDDCVWQQQPLPQGVLATLTRSYEIPASGGRGPVRLSAVVTVHRTAEQADGENAEVLEEMMRCPSQLLRAGEVLAKLTDVPSHFGDSEKGYADDVLTETGTYTSDEVGGPHPYVWEQTRIGQFTIAVSGKGSRGWSRSDLFDRLRDPHTRMRSSLRGAIGRDAPTPGVSPSASPSTDTKADVDG